MWKPEHRRAADRRGLRYPSDLTEAEWVLVAPLILPAKRGGRPRNVNIWGCPGLVDTDEAFAQGVL
jgi:hypothetical protein